MGPVKRCRKRPSREVCSKASDPLADAFDPSQELAMADLAFVVATVAVFALVALVAKGVTRL
ncbi:hypothetical protein ABZX85_37710 [Streptomyces sp. NPDC004539]|uniref:hypothetical protein n=1 Tax=Streptomyces sp. NPDC004539 TaxID=3154280 RepID=UPI0033A1339B